MSGLPKKWNRASSKPCNEDRNNYSLSECTRTHSGFNTNTSEYHGNSANIVE
ncbi:hypothetical protein K443DRAFT_12662 [Laccaria amethystina LaAM-08-1]|uniref:Uncharacterized protein n=1 Tax=Laccaria amethystina LaAM-08-1 TaxID=1095629 RepID=A0A0C9WR09_9AGAR|nr:hypothetical protein K443DRAFT_12662 [Laccaria amethystina LaAM-08-1]